LVDDADLTPEWVLREVVPRLTDPGTVARMSEAAAHAGSRDADVVLARHVLSVVAEYRRFRRDRA
ncbi:MAG TPA: hypothetical protein VKQ07_05210, partial [Jatrophihabitantaceae bacterium]|nr:hypothetical protein [Jatrophihabitantaceae bacterium]